MILDHIRTRFFGGDLYVRATYMRVYTVTSILLCYVFVSEKHSSYMSSVVFFVQLYKDLLHPSVEEEKRRCKLKRLVQSPNSYFMDVKCPGVHCSIYRIL